PPRLWKLYPQSAAGVPEWIDDPHYPSLDRKKVYGLNDGVGLWLVALVASNEPLPSYAEWREQHPSGPWPQQGAAAVGVVEETQLIFNRQAVGLDALSESHNLTFDATLSGLLIQ